MIASRKGAIYLIGIHMVPNIVGIVRFSYGFHRTGAQGLVLDVLLGAECFLNIISDAAVIRLLWQAEKSKATSAGHAAVSTVLRAFVAWNTVAMLFCCGANLAGLRYPPKWYTEQDADKITLEQQVKIVVIWSPCIIMAGFCKLYYTTKLYAFYKVYESTGGKAFDGAAEVRATPGDLSQHGGHPTTRPQRSIPQPEIDPAIFRDPTPIFPASGLSSFVPSPAHPQMYPAGLSRFIITPVPASPVGAASRSPGRIPVGPGFPPTQQRLTSSGPISNALTPSTPTPIAQTPSRGSKSSGGTTSSASRSGDARVPQTLETPTPASRTPTASGAVSTAPATSSQRSTPGGPMTPYANVAVDRTAVGVNAARSEQEVPPSRVMKARRPVPPPPAGTRKSKKHR
ncbi:ESX-1 secretion-associated protein EspK-like isoform X2 [Dermacentor albipictus]|uniref:ESX-1 secretion-associated protein EspK-like isoform X2 n=1 Tax=Dermacentor albipictus TaxID=60249 RepID=UPI0031FC094D